MKRSKTSSAIDYKPVIWGHRGCRGADNPAENTIEAVLEAIRQGADGVEFDVRLTSDNVPIIFHDKTLERLTKGKGRVRKTSYAEVRKLKLPGKQTIPTLAEMLDAIEPHLRLRPFKVNIEIKGKEAPYAVADEVSKRLSSGKWGIQHFHISGFKLDRLKIIRELLPDIEIGALFVQSLGERLGKGQIERLLKRAFKEMESLDAYSINLPIEYYQTPDIAKKIRKEGYQPVAWTYEETPPKAAYGLLERILEDRITIITDFPREMRVALKEAGKRA